MIVEHVWDMDYDGLTNIVDVLYPPPAQQDRRPLPAEAHPDRARHRLHDRSPRQARGTDPEQASRSAGVNVPRNRDLRRLSRGLRFRLTASYALFFAVLLMGVAGLFRQRLSSELDTQIRTTSTSNGRP